MNEFPAWLASTLASDATEGRGVLPPWIGSLKSDARAVGPAFVALMSQDDNLSVRDAKEIRQMRFGVWCRGVTPAASHKNGPAVVGGTVALGGTIIRDGDLVIADEDGVVIWPKELIDDLLTKAQAKLQQDNDRLVQLQREKTRGHEE